MPTDPLVNAFAERFVHPIFLHIIKRAGGDFALSVSFFSETDLAMLEKPELVRGIEGRMLQPSPEEVVLTSNACADMAAGAPNKGINLIQ